MLLCHTVFTSMYVCTHCLNATKETKTNFFFATFRARQTRLVLFLSSTTGASQFFSLFQYLALNTCSNTYRTGKSWDSPVFKWNMTFYF